MARGGGAVEAVDDDAADSPGLTVARHDDVDRCTEVSGEAVQGCGRPMTENGAGPGPEHDGP